MNDIASLLFALNLLLTIVDASIAYYQAHHLVTFMNIGAEDSDRGVRNMRRLLPVVVALYAGFNCYSYSMRHTGYLAAVTAVLVADILLQWHLAARAGKLRN